MNILLLRGFNNYFNRVVKKYSTLSDYRNNSASYLDLASINFNPNDGVVTELIIGSTDQKENNAPLAWDEIGTPDYCVCYEDNTIKFRWFVLESERTRKGQYRIALKRDVVAENFDKVMTAPCFVEKGYVNNISNPLLYNNENMSYNQIKTGEDVLQDSTESGWIVGYVSKSFNNTSGLTPGAISADDADPISYIDEEDLPFTINTSEATTVIDADATKTDLRVIMPVAWCDARYGGWGTAYHRRTQSLILYGNGAGSVSNNIPYNIDDGYLTTSTIETYRYPADTFLAGGTFADVSFEAMNSAMRVDKVNQGSYGLSINALNNDLTLTANISENSASRVNLVAKKYAAIPTEITNGTYGTAPAHLYVDYAKIITNTAYNQMKSYYNSHYNWNTLVSYFNSRLSTNLSNYNANIKTSTNNALSYYNGKIVKKDGKYYKIFVASTNSYHIIIHSSTTNLQPTYTVNGSNTIQVDTDNTYSNYLNNIINSFMNGVKDDQNNNLFTGSTTNKGAMSVIEILPKYTITIEEVSNELVMTGGTSENFSASEYGQGITYDAAYNIFAIPYGRIGFKPTNSQNVYYTSKSEGIGIGRWLATALGSSNIYDLQILPYCPSSNIREYMNANTILDLSAISGRYQLVFRAPSGTPTSSTSSWQPCSFIFTALSCRGEFDITKNIEVPETGYSRALDYKISNETQLIRLCSPNWGSMFEFSLAKNNGVSIFNVDYTYKPYQPYIHINPDFKNLYGRDYNDSRGLILGGDFSVQSSESAWVEYVNNNKNYQSIFNRQIENMDVNNQIAKEQLDWQTFAGYFGGGISGGIGGALAGAKVGGPYGAIAGAIGGAYMGTVGAVIGGEMDKDWLARQQAEAKDYAKDMYGYQLGNIKARPNSLARTEALNNNNKIWPVIEIYDCTDEERVNLINKLRYNSMTIMATGTLNDYSHSEDFNLLYVKGQIIRLDNINDDFHIADAIYQEVLKGFFVPQEGE